MNQDVVTLANKGPGEAWLAAQAFGCDMDLLEESLALSPSERLRLHDIALGRVAQLEAAMKEDLGGHRPTS
jgi:hypothetical protein